MSTTVQDKPVATMKITDRCDKCGAQALTTYKDSGEAESVLMFCGNHARSLDKGLLAAKFTITADDRPVLAFEESKQRSTGSVVL